ncbi:MAG TPA: hypothetical protein ENG10_03230, partial [Candidatus Bathyarchaeota archaeon]|nr:hypothetical protein [Candidatus Bathyarchaeota archaeon]HEX69290.1 hypothetical protein [Candidatus Bathyarchaeota archaeon]
MSEQKPLGSIREVSGDKITFFLDKNHSLSFGQIVRINSADRIFYARVVNSKSGSTLKTDEQLREAEGKEAFGPYSSYRCVEAVLFLEKRDGRVRAPTFNPNYMDKVYAATEEDCSILKLDGPLK